MGRARTLDRSVASALLLLGCRMDNPEFEGGDELADDAMTSESNEGESGESESGESGSTESGEASTETSTDATDESTTENSTLDTTTTSEGESETTATSESEGETGMPCPDGESDCEGICVDLDTDPLNCGTCGIECADNEKCVGACSPKKYVFVTSEPRNGAMGGILGADEFCNDLAFQAGLPGDYLAWNSTVLSYPNFDFVQEGVYIRTDEQVIANSYEDLTDGNIAHPINLDENGFATAVMGVAGCNNVTSPVWSNTTPFGEFAGGSACTGWTINSNITTATIGTALATDASWSQIPNCNVPCGSFLPIYCVQQNP
jgi:hypothetical protein